jgi:hypothetical protein
MELVDGQDDEAATRQKDRDHCQCNLVVRPRITLRLDGTISLQLPETADQSWIEVAASGYACAARWLA